ncbi:uncharacterized protein LOC133172927 isoform X2 [Saccostrea echinata]|uniref:uncharacterized protein LOC133172927 isoform X2 n=1 Tax=Saccostrea echinata TaxID=191078 RepID=UPI002A80C4CC|nr:uncharacterized protein LOC133172927 isoform X2 [Saccostrea echinata]
MKSLLRFLTIVSFQQMLSTESPCDILQCEHSSPCMIINEVSKNGSYIAKAKCECIGSYAGQRCESKLSILESKITSSSISFTVIINSLKPIQDSVQYVTDDITIHYWQNYSQSTCSIHPGKLESVQKIPHLLPGTFYTLCVLSGHVNFCSLKEQLNSSLSCKNFLTPVSDLENSGYEQEWIIPVIITCSIMIFFSSLCLCSVINCRKRDKVENKHHKEQKHNEELDFFLPKVGICENVPNVSERTIEVPIFPTSVPIVRPPKSPGRPPYKISQQSLGYSSFTMKNSKSFPLNTVLEYSGDECQEDEINVLISHNKEQV